MPVGQLALHILDQVVLQGHFKQHLLEQLQCHLCHSRLLSFMSLE